MTQHNDTHQKDLHVTLSISDTQQKTTLSIIMLCHYAECRYAECRYAECRYAVFLEQSNI
jgi:hypothetical protein